MKGSCPCGGVTVSVAHKPEILNSCDCTLCFRLGTLWGYFDPEDVTIEGETGTFVRSDMQAVAGIHFCPGCGATINWQFLAEPPPRPLMGVNMRLFGPEQLLGIAVYFSDGRNRNEGSEERPAPRHPEVPFAFDAPF